MQRSRDIDGGGLYVGRVTPLSARIAKRAISCSIASRVLLTSPLSLSAATRNDNALDCRVAQVTPALKLAPRILFWLESAYPVSEGIQGAPHASSRVSCDVGDRLLSLVDAQTDLATHDRS
jgi:hypothetical protein